MGIFLIKIYFKCYNENNDSKPSKIIIKDNKNNNSKPEKIIIMDNKIHKSIPNPLFKNQQIITDNHKISTNINGIKMFCYEVYKLNNIKSSIYIAFQNLDKNIEILKYDFKTFSKILIITINNDSEIIKYFNDEIQNKEYLIIQTFFDIYIYLIIDEKVYEKVYSYQEEGIISRGAGGFYKGKLPISRFVIFRDEYENINYFIISYFYRVDCSSMCKKISILKFNKNILIKVKEIVSGDSQINRKKLFLIWEDKKSKLYYLIYNTYSDLTLLDINDKKKAETLTFHEILKVFGEYLGCIINSREGKDFLYIFDYCGLLIIFDLNIKQKIKILDIINNIESLVNWNNNYIILGAKKNIYIFDTINEKIINKKSFNLQNDIISINKYIFEEFKFYSLCFNSYDNKLRILY